MTTCKFVLAAIIAASCQRGLAASDLVGFWGFKDGASGTDVSTVVNTAGSGTYVGTASKTANDGVMPFFTNDAPARVIRAKDAGEILCVDPQAIKFMYDPAVATPELLITPPGGKLDFADLMPEIIGKPFTIEFFIKMDENFEYKGAGNYTYNSKTACSFGTSSKAVKFIAPNGVAAGKQITGFAAQVYNGGSMTVSAVNDGKWRHVAIVFTPEAAGSAIGQLDLYCDYVKTTKPALSFTNDVYGSNPIFRLGTGRPGVENTEPFQGSISSLRVTAASLSVGDFMVADNVPEVSGRGMIGLYPFKDGAAGSSADTIHNAADDDLFAGKALPASNATQSKGAAPTFSTDVPGKYIYSNAAQRVCLATDIQSLHFTPGTSAGGGGKVELADLSSSLGRLEAYTVEFFFRSKATQAYRTPIGWKVDDTAGFKVNFTDGTPTSDLGTGILEVLTNETGWVHTLASVAYNSSTSYTTNSWHHLAIVCNTVAGEAKLYVDYHQPVSVSFANRITSKRNPLTLGTSAFVNQAIAEAYGGYIACPRVTAYALSVEDFMVASEKAVDPDTVFAWNFEDGVGHTGENVGIADGYPTTAMNSADTTVYNESYSANQTYPKFADGLKRGRSVSWGGVNMWENQTCCRFLGYSSATTLKQYSGTEMNLPGSRIPGHPESWTMEAFVKREFAQEVENPYGALLFGKIGPGKSHASPIVYPQYCWMLTQLKDGKLKLFWTQNDRDVYDKDSTSYKSAVTSSNYLDDGRWHHVALTYDKPTKTFKVHYDRKVVLTAVVGEGLYELYDGPYNYYFSRMELTYGFQGWMDEIRFSRVVRTPESFVAFEPTGLLIICR